MARGVRAIGRLGEDRRRLWPAALALAACGGLGLSACEGTPTGRQPDAAAPPLLSADDLLPVDCLLPGQVRQLGQMTTYVSRPRPVKTSAADCRLRGGEYVAWDRADLASALKVWLPRAQEGDQAAQAAVGDIYLKGYGFAPDPVTAAVWYRRAADQGSAPAAIDLGLLYERGLGVPQDMGQALYWYRRATGLSEAELRPSQAAQDATIDALRAQVAALQGELATTRAALAEREADLGRQQEGAAASQAALRRQRASLEAERKRAEAQAQRVHVLEQERDRLAAERDRLIREREPAPPPPAPPSPASPAPPPPAAPIYRGGLDAARAKAAAAEVQVDQARSELAAQQAEIDRRQREMAEGEAQLEAIEREAARLDAAIARLREEAARRQAEIEALKAGAPTATAPTIEILDPVVARQRGGAEVKVRPGISRRVVVGRVNAPAGVLSLTINDHSVEPDANGLFRTEVNVPSRGAEVGIVAIDREGRRADVSFRILPEEAVATKGPGGADGTLDPVAAGIDFGTYHALIIANNQYRYLPKLETAVADGEAMAELLERRYGFQTTLLVNADRYRILSELNRLREKLTDKDNLVIYYAGHGEIDRVNQRGSWLPVDAEPESTANWISNVAITDLLNAMQAKHVLVIADSCYSGSLTRSALARLQAGMSIEARRKWIKAVNAQRARVALTSGGLKPVLDTVGGQHSLFAQALLDVLEAQSGVLDARQLATEVSRRVRERALAIGVEQVPEYAPIQFAGHGGGEFFFVPPATAQTAG